MLGNSPISVSLPVKDIERAKKFYSDTLGLKAKTDMGPAGVVYECGQGTAMFIYESAFAGTNKATAAAWDVDDLDAEMAEMRKNGVVFEEYDMPGLKTVNGVASYEGSMKSAWFKDPDGNILAVGEMSK